MIPDEFEKNIEKEVQQVNRNLFQLKFLVNPKAYSRLIGKQGITKNQIESETKTKIIFPRREEHEHNWMVSITGKSKKNVCAARIKYKQLIASIRNEIPNTHVIQAVVGSDNIKCSLNHLKELILSEQYPGIDENLFKPSNLLHITLNKCQLIDDQDQAKAIQIFQQCCQDFVDQKTPIVATCCGLNVFENETASDVKVIFAKVESEQLQELGNKITKKFKENHLTKEYLSDIVNLHITIMNSTYRSHIKSEASRRFDATDILIGYFDFEFGDLTVNEIHLSQMAPYDKIGEYKTLYKVSI